METNPTYYIDLVTRYFSGEATPGEIRELEAWVNADSANREMFSAYQETWKILGSVKNYPSAELDREWEFLKSRINENPVLSMVSPIMFQSFKSKIRNRQSQILYLSLRIAAIFLLMAIPVFFLYRSFGPPADKQLVAGNEIAEHILPDGTVVTMNEGATLTYPSRFEGSFRKVTLQGEAWFEVTPDKSKPFVIAAGNVRIRVTGTSFFVNTKTWNDTREVILATGKVNVYYENEPAIGALLLPGDKAELVTNGYSIIKTPNDDQNYLAWKTKHMVFSNTPLNVVVALLTRVYHTNIHISGDRLSDCRITTTFDKQSLESVLNVLKATLDLQVRNTGAGIELSGHGCN